MCNCYMQAPSRWEGSGRFKIPSSGVVPTSALGVRVHGWLPGLFLFSGIRPGGRSRKSTKRVGTRLAEVHEGKDPVGLKFRAPESCLPPPLADGCTAGFRVSAISQGSAPADAAVSPPRE